jgi:hypothetical protein
MKLKRLVKLKEIKTYYCEAADGEIGSLEDIYFDDSCLAVQFVIVHSKLRLAGRKVLISPFTIGKIDEKNQLVYVELALQQIKNSPPLDTDQPISRQYEEKYFQYYGWPPYWDRLSWPNTSPLKSSTVIALNRIQEVSTRPENHLHEASQILNFGVVSTEGKIGWLNDLIIDTHYWVIRYLEIDTRKWLHSKDFALITPTTIASINWPENRICVDLDREALQKAPPYDANAPISRQYESQILKHYSEKIYWK